MNEKIGLACFNRDGSWFIRIIKKSIADYDRKRSFYSITFKRGKDLQVAKFQLFKIMRRRFNVEPVHGGI